MEFVEKIVLSEKTLGSDNGEVKLYAGLQAFVVLWKDFAY